MLRASHWMPGSKNKALLSFLSARFSAYLSWSFAPQSVQHRPYFHQRCCAAGGRLSRLCISSSGLNIDVDWRKLETLTSKRDRLPVLLLANDHSEGHRQQQRRGWCAAGSPRSSTIDPLMTGPVAAAGGAGDVGARQQEQEQEELVLDREFFSKETTVVAVKLPAKRTR